MAHCKAQLARTISTRRRFDNTPTCHSVRVWLRAPKARSSSAITSVEKAASLAPVRLPSRYHSYAKAPRATLAVRQPTCHPTISSSVVPFSSCLQSLPASESFPMSQLFNDVAKVLEFQHQSFQRTPRTDLL